MTSTPGTTGKLISSGSDSPQEEPSLTLAVVIPTLNEEPVLPGLLASLRNQSHRTERVIVADGGSKDGTISIAHQAGAEVVAASNRGRGGQVAAALAKATEEIVLVAHADMLLPSRRWREFAGRWRNGRTLPVDAWDIVSTELLWC